MDIERLKKLIQSEDSDLWDYKEELLALIDEALQAYQPTISKTETTSDPRKWVAVKNGRGGHECSFCHEYAPSYQNGTEWLSCYCPNCGRRLEDWKQ